MDFGVYVTEKMAALRLADLRAESERIGCLRWARPARHGVWSGLGVLLIRLGCWLAQDGSAGPNAGVRVAR
jgi:hypothetical protein